MRNPNYRAKRKKKDFEEQQQRFLGIINAWYKSAKNCMGMRLEIYSSEGSLHQHIKLKHP
jgi:hypothetical protein